MTPQTDEAPLQSQPESMGEISRIFGVFFSPQSAFADIVRRPSWWVPVLLSTIMGITVVSVISQRVGWEQVIRTAVQQSSRTQNIPPAQLEQLISAQVRITQSISYVGGALGSLLYVFFAAVILKFLTDTIMGAEIGLKRMMAVVAYGFLPNLIASALSVLVLFLKNPDDVDIQNLLAFNVGAFLSPDSVPRWLISAANSLDLFSFWIIALLAIGISAAARKMTFGKALATVLFPWVLWVILKTGVAILRG